MIAVSRITGTLWFVASLMAAIGVWRVSACDAADEKLPTPSEIVAGFERNRSAFPALNISWRETRKNHEPYFKGLEDDNDRWRRSVETTTSEATRTWCLSSIQTNERILANRAQHMEVHRHRQLLTDWNRFQVRSPIQDNPGTAQFTFPNALPTPDTLQVEFGKMLIKSYTGSDEQCLIFWKSPDEDWTSPAVRRSYEHHGPLPPLAGELEKLGLGDPSANPLFTLNPIDQFFRWPLEMLQVVGNEDIEGVPCVILEMRKETTDPDPSKAVGRATDEEIAEYKGRFRVYFCARAWIDTRHGYLPRRMLLSMNRVTLDERQLTFAFKGSPVLDEIKIEKIPGGGYYPVSGNLKSYTLPVEQRKPWPTLVDYAKGASVPDQPWVLTHEVAWKTTKLEVNVPPASLELNIPEGMNVVVHEFAGAKVRMRTEAEKAQERHYAFPLPTPPRQALFAMNRVQDGKPVSQSTLLFVADADGGNPRKLTERGECTAYRWPAWSADGKWIAYAGWNERMQGYHSSRLFVVSADGGIPRELCAGRLPSFSPDGTRIVFSRDETNPGVWVVDLEGDKPVPALLDPAGISPRWSPDGTKIVYCKKGPKEANLVVLDMENGETRALFGEGDTKYRTISWSPAWSPDSRQIVFLGQTVEGATEVVVVNARGASFGFARCFPVVGNVNPTFAWSPDGNSILTSISMAPTMRQQIFSFKPSEQKPPQVLTGQDSSRINWDVAFSPDGKRIVFSSQNQLPPLVRRVLPEIRQENP